ncbi:MAG TPA: 5-oxoprolinase subunit PxpA [Burkholderiales bacterium]|nr:5-oxoprolinase subunit PxpA [Burkholderiales bacterium]
MKPTLDLNCDMGEGLGAWNMGDDEALLEHVTSANIACGFHAGDPGTIHRTVKLALAKGVAVGAHPSLPDLQGFGRRSMVVTPAETYDMVLYQVGALAGFARACGGRLAHVKPHGALYNMAARDAKLAAAIAQAVRDFDAGLVLFGLAGSELVKAGERIGLRTASEVFADRTYQQDGSLTPRSQPDAMVRDADTAIAQVRRMVNEGKVRSQQGQEAPVRADTLCIHGDEPGAVDFAKRIRAALDADGVRVAAISH